MNVLDKVLFWNIEYFFFSLSLNSFLTEGSMKARIFIHINSSIDYNAILIKTLVIWFIDVFVDFS